MRENIIRKVDPDSPLSGLVQPGDTLLSINGNEIHDVLDYKYYSYDKSLHLVLSSGSLDVQKPEGKDLGLEFEDYLMDRTRSCANRCIFCFIDQMPRGLRKTLYFKDDDARLSFLLGNYITLTNLSEREIQRIIKLHISPVNISVHTTESDLRVAMLRNPSAGNVMDIMRRFSDGGIVMNCQVVCCPGYNDGEHLQKTMEDLAALYPQVRSVSVVPVGLTKYREGLTPLTPFSAELAGQTIEQVHQFSQYCISQFGSRIFYCADELYLLSGKELPREEYYEEYYQLENGVGMLRLLETEFFSALSTADPPENCGSFSIACGTAVREFFEKLVCSANQKYDKIKGNVYAIENDFFGHSINVTGLITGQDLIAQLRGKNLGDRLLISQNCLRRAEKDFLDDITLEDAERELGVPVIPVEQDGFALFDAMCGSAGCEITKKYGEEIYE